MKAFVRRHLKWMVLGFALLLIAGVGLYWFWSPARSGPIAVKPGHRAPLRGQAGQQYSKPVQSQGKRYRVEGGITIQLQPSPATQDSSK